MSGLVGLLAGHHKTGVYRWPSALEPDEVAHAVTLAGWRFGHVDGWLAQDRTEVLHAIGSALDFPSWFGANLDALHDCLRDLESPTVLLWDGWGTLARADEPAFVAILTVLAEHTAAPAPLSTLLRGDGPATDLAYLE